MRIAFFASSLVSAYWNGAATYYRGIVRALDARGHRVTFYEPDAYSRQEHRDIEDPPWAKVVVYPATAEAPRAARRIGARFRPDRESQRRRRVRRTCSKPPCCELRNAGEPGGVLGCRRAGDARPRASRSAGSVRRADPALRRDLHLRRRRAGRLGLQALGARQCVPIYNALDPETHYPVPPDPRFSRRSRIPRQSPARPRSARRRVLFQAPRRNCPDAQFLLGGAGWGDKAKTANIRYFDHVYTRDHNAFNCTPRAVLNVSRESMARYGFSPATRVFEAAGAGACLITDAWEGIELFLEPGTRGAGRARWRRGRAALCDR